MLHDLRTRSLEEKKRQVQHVLVQCWQKVASGVPRFVALEARSSPSGPALALGAEWRIPVVVVQVLAVFLQMIPASTLVQAGPPEVLMPNEFLFQRRWIYVNF